MEATNQSSTVPMTLLPTETTDKLSFPLELLLKSGNIYQYLDKIIGPAAMLFSAVLLFEEASVTI